MTFWTIVLAGAVGGFFAGLVMFLTTLLGYWLKDKIDRRRR